MPDITENEPTQPCVGTPVSQKPLPFNHIRTPSILSSVSQSSRSGPGTARKFSNKCLHMETSLETSVSENMKLLDLAKGSYDLKTASLAAKRQKMELKAKQECEGLHYAAEERTLMIKECMQEKEFEHRECMIRYELELA